MAGEYDVLIVDDDPLQAHLLVEVLQDLGSSSRVLPEGTRAVEEARRARPRLIILDIIMPGIDGLALCMKLSPEVKAWDGRVVITSGKDRTIEEPRALRAGAAAFLQKPYRIKELASDLARLLGSAAPAAAGMRRVDVVVRVWGSRGPSLAGAPAPQASAGSAYGTRSPCVSAGLSTGEVVLLDAGTGLRDCAAALTDNAQLKAATLLLTHYHPAHIEGLAGLPLLAREGFQLRVGGPLDPDVQLPQLLDAAAGPRVGAAGARVSLFTLEEQEYQLGPQTRLRALYAQHPTTTLAYCLQALGKKIVYCPDAELAPEGELDVGNNWERLRNFALGADLLIFDSHFAPRDMPASPGHGHSSWETAVRVAAEASVRRLCLFHACLKYSDAELNALETAAKEAASEEMASIECVMAKDGLSFSL